jgi:hypothetical protein
MVFTVMNVILNVAEPIASNAMAGGAAGCHPPNRAGETPKPSAASLPLSSAYGAQRSPAPSPRARELKTEAPVRQAEAETGEPQEANGGRGFSAQVT